jgi:hypothetical protein
MLAQPRALLDGRGQLDPEALLDPAHAVASAALIAARALCVAVDLRLVKDHDAAAGRGERTPQVFDTESGQPVPVLDHDRRDPRIAQQLRKFRTAGRLARRSPRRGADCGAGAGRQAFCIPHTVKTTTN